MFYEKTISPIPFGKFVTEVLIFMEANTFFSSVWCLQLTVRPTFGSDSFFENILKTTCSYTWTALFDNLHFWLKLVCFSFCMINYSFVCQFSLHYHCVKSVQIRSLFWSVFSCIQTEYGPGITPYLDTFHAVLLYHWYCYNQNQPSGKYSAKRYSYKFHKENTGPRVSFLMKLQIYNV